MMTLLIIDILFKLLVTLFILNNAINADYFKKYITKNNLIVNIINKLYYVNVNLIYIIIAILWLIVAIIYVIISTMIKFIINLVNINKWFK